MTWEIGLEIIKALGIATVGGGLATGYWQWRAKRGELDKASDDSIRSELWRERGELVKAEQQYLKEKIDYERRIVILETNAKIAEMRAIEQDEEILKLRADIQKEKTARADVEKRWAEFLRIKD